MDAHERCYYYAATITTVSPTEVTNVAATAAVWCTLMLIVRTLAVVRLYTLCNVEADAVSATSYVHTPFKIAQAQFK
jgi:hypothetical protein